MSDDAKAVRKSHVEATLPELIAALRSAESMDRVANPRAVREIVEAYLADLERLAAECSEKAGDQTSQTEWMAGYREGMRECAAELRARARGEP